MTIERNNEDVTGEIMARYGDAKLPYDIKIGSVLFREGVFLSTLCMAAERWYLKAKKSFEPLSEEEIRERAKVIWAPDFD